MMFLVLYLNHDLIEMMQQLWRLTLTCSSFILTLYFQHWHRLLYQQYLFIVKMFVSQFMKGRYKF